MTADNDNLHEVVDELANALQTAIVLAAKVATSLRADVHDGDVLNASIVRAVAALQRLPFEQGGQ
jgi:type III secretory pathway component EscU